MNKTENKKDSIVEITKSEYRSLIRSQLWLGCLEGAGVDNWDGYEYAQEYWDENYKDEFGD